MVNFGADLGNPEISRMERKLDSKRLPMTLIGHLVGYKKIMNVYIGM